MLRRTALFLLLSGVALGLSVSSCSPAYVLRAGYEEAKILLARQEISTLLSEENSLDADTREKLSLISDVRIFAISLGLTPGESYTSYADIGTDPLVWVVTAAPKTSLEPHTWWFPLVGSVPYKGFFDKSLAEKEAHYLSKRQLDTSIRPSNAFSTLGWFNDPVLSTMLTVSTLNLVELVMHELVHNTVWIKGSAPFNETLASVVGLVGSMEYYESKKQEEKYQAAALRWAHYLRYASFLTTLRAELLELYSSPQLNDEEKLSRREQIFERAPVMWTQVFGQPPSEEAQTLLSELNNAVIVAQYTYFAQPEVIARCLEELGSVKALIAVAKHFEENVESEAREIYAQFESHCAKHTPG